MLDAAGGGAGGGTPWESYSVELMQQLIKNPDTDRYYELLTGWKRSADLINEHRWQVQNYRDNMAAAWPPDRNEAAAAYLTRLDELITNLDETYEAAIANHDAFARATLSIGLAQHDMEEIAREYQANDLAIQQFAVKQQQQESSSTPTPSPSPSGGDEPPVAPGRQEELHRKAAALMHGVSGDLALAQMNIRTPKLYEPAVRLDNPGDEPPGGYVAPPIPPITPTATGGTSSSARSSRPSVTFPASGGTSPAPNPPTTNQPPNTSTSQPGLVLGGATPPTLTPPTPGSTPIPPPLPSGTPSPATSPGFVPPSYSGFPVGGGTTIGSPAAGAGRGVPFPREGLVRPGGSIPSGIHAMPPGGMIGGTPPMGITQPGSPRGGIRQVNPVGGLIGGNQAHAPVSTAGTGSGRGVVGTPLGQPGGRAARRANEQEMNHWDPDNPWATTEGVDPVLMPPREQRIDPGPAIGLT